MIRRIKQIKRGQVTVNAIHNTESGAFRVTVKRNGNTVQLYDSVYNEMDCLSLFHKVEMRV